MNCRHAQEKVIEALAAGAAALPSEAAEHLQSCATCRSFHEAQQHLFYSLDAELRTIVDAPLPPSLLPGLRLRIENVAPPQRTWSFVLWPATGALAVACVLLYAALRHPQPPLETPVAMTPSAQWKVMPQRMASEPSNPLPESVRRSANPKTRHTQAESNASPVSGAEVLVDHSESRGLMLLAKVAFQEPKVAERLAPQHETKPLAIDPVTIPAIEIPPMAEDDR